VVDALRRRAATASVLVTTASARDAVRLADRLAVLTTGTLSAPAPIAEAHGLLVPAGAASMRIVVSATSGRAGAAALASALGADEAVRRIEATPFAGDSAVLLTVTGDDL